MTTYPAAEWSQEFDSEGSDTPRSKGSPAGTSSPVTCNSGSWLREGNYEVQPPTRTDVLSETRSFREYLRMGNEPTYRITAVTVLESMLQAILHGGCQNPYLHLQLDENGTISTDTLLDELKSVLPEKPITVPVHRLGQVPKEILENIFSYLSPDSIMAAEKVCIHWRWQSCSMLIWRNFCVDVWPRYTDAKEKMLKKQSTQSVDGTPIKHGRLWWRRTFFQKRNSELDWLSNGPKKKIITDRQILSQNNGIHCIQFDSTELMTGSGTTHEIGIWDMETFELKSSLSGHTSAVTCLQFDDEKVVSGSLDSTIRLWERGTNVCNKTLMGHGDKVWCVQFAGDRLVSGSSDKTVRLWNVESGEHICSLRDHRTSVSCVKMDGSIVVSGSAGNSIRVWDIGESPICICKLRGHSKGVFCLQFDHAKILSGSLDNTIRMWDRRDKFSLIKTVQAGDGSDEANKGIICFSYDDTKLVSGGADNVVKIWDLRTWKKVQTLSAHNHWITSLQFDDTKLITGSRDKTVKLWKISDPAREVGYPSYDEFRMYEY
eukprot:TRINITY_DN10251_c0_g1_i1.p1 TRINITY_DN10251_c0_g1~~TRINITY_DN10251_c0_g1_i1.p1  ORF type:complete len:545 (+),score=66.07 TRINITY_DN10251_c0_g1_i1:120-1754(+)